jgi:hypothetical protein
VCEQRSAINTSRTNHSIFSDDFPAARPTNKETRCITRGTTTRGSGGRIRRQRGPKRGRGRVGEVRREAAVRGGLLLAGNDETDGLPRRKELHRREMKERERERERRTSDAGRRRVGEGRSSFGRILDEVPPLSAQDKTHLPARGCRLARPGDFITREHTLPVVPLWDRGGEGPWTAAPPQPPHV